MEAIDASKYVDVKNDIIRISKGPQFNTMASPYLALLSLTFFILSVYCFITIDIVLAIILLFISILIFNVAIDICGIEINRNNKTIREYKSIFFYKIGEFRSISDFKAIQLLQESVVVPTSEYSDHKTDTFHYYRIYLVDEINKNQIFLAEFKNFYKAENVSKRIAYLTGLTYTNLLRKGIRKVSIV